MWDEPQASKVRNSFHKGDFVAVSGRLKAHKYMAREEGGERMALEVRQQYTHTKGASVMIMRHLISASVQHTVHVGARWVRHRVAPSGTPHCFIFLHHANFLPTPLSPHSQLE